MGASLRHRRFPHREGPQVLRTQHPAVAVFGATSYQGVFSPGAFTATAVCLVSDASDDIAAVPVLTTAGPKEARVEARAACVAIQEQLGVAPNLMMGNAGPLLTRAGKAVRLATHHRQPPLRGGLFMYCGATLRAVLGNAVEISEDFRRAAGDIPFVGVSTLGEEGAFLGTRGQNRHGNLMCATVLFE